MSDSVDFAGCKTHLLDGLQDLLLVGFGRSLLEVLGFVRSETGGVLNAVTVNRHAMNDRKGKWACAMRMQRSGVWYNVDSRYGEVKPWVKHGPNVCYRLLARV